MSSVDHERIEELKKEFFELNRQEEELCRQMAGIIINNCEGEAADIQSFYIALFGKNGDGQNAGYDHFAKYKALARKLEVEAVQDAPIIIERDQGYVMGIIRPDMVRRQGKPYRLRLDGKTGNTHAGYQGLIELPIQSINEKFMNDRNMQLVNYAEWNILARATRTFGATSSVEFTGVESIHLGFPEDVEVAATLGDKALRGVTAYHDYMLTRSVEDVARTV